MRRFPMRLYPYTRAFNKLCGNYEAILRRRIGRLYCAMLAISGDALGWLLAIGFALERICVALNQEC